MNTACTPAPESHMEGHKSLIRLTLDRFFEHRMAVLGLLVIVFFCLVALLTDVIAGWLGADANAPDILNRYGPWSAANWLGTDEVGRDVLIRLVYGTRISLMVAFVAASAAMVLGTAVGMAAGYFGGWVDTVLMRIVDSLLALPLLPVMIILAAADFTKIPLLGGFMSGSDASIAKLIIIFGVFSWMVQARLVRGAILEIRERDFVLAARIDGQSTAGILLGEILPNVLSPVIVSVTLNVGTSILFEAALSFLGLGIQPPAPSWGNMLNNALEVIYLQPSNVVIPGLLIFLVVVSFNFLGDGLQDALDPKAIRR